MNNLDIKYAAAYNFLCFGPEGIQLEFEKYGPIVLVRGFNADVKPDQCPLFPADREEQERLSSNGTGKSTLQEILSFAFFGKTIKNHKKIKVDQVCHNLIGKKCSVEVIWDKYRIVRSRKPSSVRFWESEEHLWNDDTELTQGKKNDIEEKILEKVGLSYEAFVNICLFTDDQKMCFLESDAPTKREIVENLMALTKYRNWHNSANEYLKELKKKIKTLNSEYEVLLGVKSASESRLENARKQEKVWHTNRLSELKSLVIKLKSKKEELATTDIGKELLRYQEAQEKISSLKKDIESKEKALEELNVSLENSKKKKELLDIKIKENSDKKSEVDMSYYKCFTDLKNVKDKAINLEHGGTCSTCYGIIDENNFKDVVAQHKVEYEIAENAYKEAKEEQTSLLKKLNQLNELVDKLKPVIASVERKIKDKSQEIRTLRNELVELAKIREPKADSHQLLLEQQISNFKEQILEKKKECEGDSPYKQIIIHSTKEFESATEDCVEKKKQLTESEDDLPYYSYWIKAFGDKGIRKLVIDGIIPALNSKVNYWLQFLIDNKIQIKFDNELNETIERNPADGDPFVYHAMSTGERRRLNLAVSQAFAHIMSVSTGTNPSLVFLDEVTTNIDPLGVQGIYNMICELAQEKQVFVTTHDQDLQKLLEGAHTIKLEKRGGITKMINKD